ncbi:MAG: Calx-beta domain-containing protein [Caldilineaceae bacterium]
MARLRQTIYTYRIITVPFIAVTLLLLLGQGMSYVAHAESFPPPGMGYLDFGYGADPTGDLGERTPTESKPESKLWWNDGFWWGSMYSQSLHVYHIYRLNWGTQQWEDTHVPLDDRMDSRADVLWDADHQKLYVASHRAQQNPSHVSGADNHARLYRYSYDASAQTYLLDAGFPVTINSDKTESLVFDKDSTGRLWITYVSRENAVDPNFYLLYVNSTTITDTNNPLASDRNWGAPLAMTTVFTEEAHVERSDLSALVAFRDDEGDKIGVMWSNARLGTLEFASHRDSVADRASGWSIQVGITTPNGPDDHMNLKSLQTTTSGQVFAAIKTSDISSTEPLIGLVARDVDGVFSFRQYSTVADNDTRPLLLIDEGDVNNAADNQVHLFVSGVPQGSQICYKSLAIPAPTTPLSTGLGQFTAGNCGMPFIVDASGVYTTIRDPSSSKQNPNLTTGMVVLASDVLQRVYVHNGVGNPPPVVTARSPQMGASDVAADAVITVTFSKPMAEASLTGNFIVSNGSTVSGTIAYDPNSRTAIFTPDTPLEPNATYTVTLLNGIQDTTGLALNEGIDAGPVIEQWSFTTAATYVEFANATYSVLEPAGSALITVTLGGAVPNTVTVTYATSDGTAVATEDYTTTIGMLTFAPGEVQKSFTVPIINDVADESNETLNLSLSNPTNAVLGAQATAALTIIDDEGVPSVQFAPTSYAVDEGATAIVHVELSHMSALSVTVNYATSDGSATAGNDYVAASGVLTFTPGQLSKDIVISTTTDAVDEPSENLNLTLSAPTNAELGSPGDTASIVIRDKTPAAALRFSSATYSVNEGDGSATIEVTLSPASASAVTVTYATANDTAKVDTDYSAANGQLVFAPGETSKSFSVAIVNDQLNENDETLQLHLSAPVNAVLGVPQNAVLTIVDNDPLPQITFSSATYSVGEGAQKAIIEVKLNTVSGRGVTADYNTSNGTATAGSDYASAAGTLIIPAGSITTTFEVDIVNDQVDEPDETVNLALSLPSEAQLGTPSTATLTIVDNDEPTTEPEKKIYLPVIIK